MVLKIALPVTPDVSKFECCVAFRFRVNGGHGQTDERTDRLGIMRIPPRGGPHKNTTFTLGLTYVTVYHTCTTQ